METVLRKDTLTETYMDIKNLIYDIVWKFKKRYGGEFEDLLSEAHFLFILAFDSHEETIASLSTWLHFRIWKGLLDYQKGERKNHFLHYEEIPFEMEAKESFLCFSNLFEEIGEDSKTIIKLILDPPDIMKRVFEMEGNKRKKRRILKQHLSKMGFCNKRIKYLHEEIAMAMNK